MYTTPSAVCLCNNTGLVSLILLGWELRVLYHSTMCTRHSDLVSFAIPIFHINLLVQLNTLHIIMYIPLYRSPKPSSRPTFTNLLQSLQEPSAHVLHWTEEDSQGHPQATCLGASMEAGIDLYPDLQIMHSKMCV